MNKEVKKRALELYASGMTNKSAMARIISEELSLEYNAVRHATSRCILKVEAKKHDPALIAECERVGIDPSKVDAYWHKSKHFSLKVKGDSNEFRYEDFRDNLIEEISKWSPKYVTIERKPIKDGHCLLFDPADIHIGKLCSSFETGEDYNQQIAVKRVREGLHGIIQKSNGWNIDKVIFVAGNDVLHTDTPRRTTTSGTPQDTDGMWYDNFVIAKKLIVEIIETLMTIADVEVVYNPSNHDYMSGFMMIDSVKSWFRESNNVSFNTDMSHRKYSVYGKNLIGTTHMDGAKVTDLPMLMAHEASEHWHKCKHRYIFGHHIHHKTSKDYMSVCVETLRSPSGTDSWHHRQGYQWSPVAVEGFVFHKEHGQIARLSHLF